MTSMRFTRLGTLIAFALTSALTLAVPAPAAAQSTDLSGTWKLNLQKSFLAGDHPYKDYALTTTIVQKPGLIQKTEVAVHVNVVNIPLPDSKSTVEFATDGKEHDVTNPPSFPGMPPAHMQVAAEWQAGTLLITEIAPTTATAATTQRRYFLSSDGSELVELVQAHNRYGDTAQRLVFDKQP